MTDSIQALVSRMTEWQSARRLAQTAQKWRDLVNLRCAHFIELHKSGRWTHYYDEARFLALMREAVDLAERWAVIAPRPDDAAAAEPKPAVPARYRPAA